MGYSICSILRHQYHIRMHHHHNGERDNAILTELATGVMVLRQTTIRNLQCLYRNEIITEKSSLVGCWYDNTSLKEAKPNKCYQQPMKLEKQHLKPSTHHSQFEILLSAIMLVAFLPLFFLALFPPMVFPDPSSPSAAPVC